MKSIQKKRKDMQEWTRLRYKKTSVYVYQNGADWFVPDTKADRLLQSGNTQSIAYKKLRARLPKPPSYQRTEHIPHLEEFWIHLTNRCNLMCKHCLFSSSPQDKDTLCFETIQKHLHEAYALGCRLFILSGGEPLVHPQILAIIEIILAMQGAEVAVLTNGLLLEKTFTGKDFPKERLHFQISLDGLPKQHDALRGEGSFDKLTYQLSWLKQQGYSFSLSVCLHPKNIQTLDALIALVASLGAGHLHLLWYFIRGRGHKKDFIAPKKLVKTLIDACLVAEKCGVIIDNIEALKTQIYAPKGTVHDGSSSGRSSLALGFDEKFYPSAALVGIDEVCLQGRTIEEALHCKIAKEIQKQSVLALSHPLRFLLGGGDLDHSYMHAQTFMGDDPYEIVLEQLALWLIATEAQKHALSVHEAHLKLEMGEILYSCGAHEGVVHTHANCLIATGENASLRLVKSFYNEAAQEDNDDILNPVCYEESYLQHIPSHLRFRGYGCGSPILEANLKEGEVMLDLGSGRGIECFIASKLVGRSGRVRGVDMLDSMLALAREGIEPIAQNLGYANLSFVKG
ncbi:MAG: radical SAM protein, partial [Sulfurospirillaceae bacterium]|nr:radical SAM protein [Sulfurospirillaceae bacterium]